MKLSYASHQGFHNTSPNPAERKAVLLLFNDTCVKKNPTHNSVNQHRLNIY